MTQIMAQAEAIHKQLCMNANPNSLRSEPTSHIRRDSKHLNPPRRCSQEMHEWTDPHTMEVGRMKVGDFLVLLFTTLRLSQFPVPHIMSPNGNHQRTEEVIRCTIPHPCSYTDIMCSAYSPKCERDRILRCNSNEDLPSTQVDLSFPGSGQVLGAEHGNGKFCFSFRRCRHILKRLPGQYHLR